MTLCSLVNRFENVIYISCNPETYVRDLSKLTDYKISKIEFFDQFVNTNHLEHNVHSPKIKMD